ncbi:sensor histidine kinase [Microbacteriaceae bacterium 4G12]
MFQRTRIRLTILNSLVFIILIGILGSIIYTYAQTRLYKDINHALERRIVEIVELKNRIPAKGYGARDPRFIILVWNEKNELISPLPETSVLMKNESIIRPKTLNQIQDIQVENYYFRSLATQVDSDLGKVTVQVIRNIDSEKEMLDVLLLILIVGCGISSICAVVAGYFLAGKALVPIKNAWQKQQQFVSDASHELRTPLAVIQSKTDVLFQSPSSTIEEKVMDISTISKECRRLSRLVANLLMLARSDSDEMEMDKKRFLLDELLREIVDHYSEIASYQEKQIILNSEDWVFFIGDKERIHQLLVILLDNAMKYTQEGGNIQLSCSQNVHSIVIKVQDNGIGIEEKDLPKIFDRFYQGDKARSTSEGAGLGLSIAKWIIEKHYGKVKVQSKVGEGTCFEIIFPKQQRV